MAAREFALKVRIFALAKELGLDNKELVRLALDAGLQVKSSPLASVTEEQATQLREMAKNKPSAPVEVAREEVTPIREATGDRKLKDLGRTGGAGSVTARRRRQIGEVEDVQAEDFESKEEVEAEEPSSEPAAAEEAKAAAETEAAAETTAKEPAPVAEAAAEVVAEPETAVEESATKDSVTEEPAAAEPAAAEPEQVAAKEKVAAAAEAETAAASESEVAAEATDSADAAEASEKSDETKPHSKEDYVAPRGRTIGVREMKPVGTIREGSRNKKARKKSAEEKDKKPNLPNIVLPNFTGPKGGEPKKDEPAQKPDMAFSADFLNQKSPLQERLRRGETGGKGGTGRGAVSPGANRPPMGLNDVRDRRNKSPQQRRGHLARDDENRIKRRNLRARTRKNRGPVELKTEATVEFPMSGRDLCEAIGRPFKELFPIIKAIKEVPFPRINDMITEEEAMEICLELGVELHVKEKETLEDVLLRRIEDGIPEDAVTEARPPVVTILGHVDHGKTTLVDRLRGSNVVDGEAGGITQHIAAYQVDREGNKLTFVDTPGHAAFGQMRARGANVTDIVVLVVAADDGVMPQTVESIAHAKAAGVPIIVAMNKCDLPDRDEQKVLTDLTQHDLQPQEWGGSTEVVRVSALKGEGIDDLLDLILLTAEVEELEAAPDVPSYGVCLEGFRNEGRGPMAWAIVQQGTLRVGDNLVCGAAYGRVRAMYDDRDREITAAGPSTPVRITGLSDVPGAGSHFFEMDEVDDAREVAEQREREGRQEHLAKWGGGATTIDKILAGPGPKNLNLIIKADTPGSIEAILHEIEKFDHDEVAVRILHQGVGGVNESDVYLAASSGAVVIAFQVVPDDNAASLADKESVEIRRYSIIYEVADDIRAGLEGLLDPDRQEVSTGRAIVLQTFSISRYGTIAGCRVLNGTIGRNNRVHVIRDQTILNDYALASLRREKDDVREVRDGMECGIRLDGFNDIKEGDLLEAFRIDEVARSLE